ncbi:MAG: GLUG motif-containing protein [Pseudomonadota bacterium]
MKRFPAILRQLVGSVTPLFVTVLVACGANNLDLASQGSLTSDADAIAQCAPPILAALTGLVTCGGGGVRVVLNPNKPVGTAAANRDAGGIPFEEMKITWTYPAGDRTGVNFEIQRWQGTSFITLATNTADPKLYYDRNLAPGTMYTYRINAIDANGNTYSDNFSGATLVATGSPSAPAYLTYVLVPSPLAIDLTWVDQSSNETNFLIERSVDGLAFALLTPAPGLAANIVTYRDTALSYNHSYSYRVYAKNAAGRSPNSNEVTVAIGSAPIPAAPSALVSTFVSATQITLQFNDNSTNEDSFVVQRKIVPPSPTPEPAFSDLQTLSAHPGTGSVTFADTSVAAGTTYKYRVLAKNGTLFSSPSNELTVSTPDMGTCVSAATPFGNGDGSAAYPFLICSPNQLDQVRNYSDKHFKMTADVDMSYPSYTGTFLPIPLFTGRFNGNGKRILKLRQYLSLTTLTGGLFGVAQGAVIENVNLEDAQISGYSLSYTEIGFVGPLVGEARANTSIVNSHAMGGSTYVSLVPHLGWRIGGLVGLLTGNSSIERSHSTVAIWAADQAVVGGLVGRQENSSISNSYASGEIRKQIIVCWDCSQLPDASVVGGLVGAVTGSTISNSYATGFVWLPATYQGGLVGAADTSSAPNSFWNVDMTYLSSSALGLPKSDSAMKLQGTFDPPWDFRPSIGIWKMPTAGSLYPYAVHQ